METDKRASTEKSILENESDLGDISVNVLCSNCNKLTNINSVDFVPQRKTISDLLKSTTDGIIILSYFQKYSTLSDCLFNNLTRLIIDQEIFLILKNEKTTIENPLKHVEIPSKTLIKLANEVNQIFNFRQAIFYMPGFYEGQHKTVPAGKFVGRINYCRKLLSEVGLFKPIIRTPATITESDSEAALRFLKLNEFADDWNKVIECWEETYFVRNSTIKNKDDGGLWQFIEFPCLENERAPQLILLDFNRKFAQNNIIANDAWPNLRKCFENFIDAKQIIADEIQTSVKQLTTLNDDCKDGIIFMLLPYAMKSTTWCNPSVNKDKQSTKRRKIDAEEVILKRRREVETFIVHTEVLDDLQNIIQKKKEYYASQNLIEKPYIVFVGSITSIVACYTVFGHISYKLNTPLEAVELSLKLYLAYNCIYPKDTYFVWLLLQRVYMNLSLKGDKSSVGFSKALAFIEEKMTS